MAARKLEREQIYSRPEAEKLFDRDRLLRRLHTKLNIKLVYLIGNNAAEGENYILIC